MDASMNNEEADEPSVWRFMSFGIVAEDNLKGEETIKVWLAELLPFESGEVNNAKLEQGQEIADINGVKRKVKVDRRSTTDPDWYCTTDGRFTPPNVVAGETVEIYQYGNEDRFRWVANGRQPNLRRLEHVTHAYSNLRAGQKPYDMESSYGWTFSTREKFVRIWTTTSDGERVAYDFMIDTNESMVTLKDDRNNKFVIDSMQDHIYWLTGKNASLRLQGEDLISNVPKSSSWTTGTTWLVKAGQPATINAPVINLTSPLINLGSTSVVTPSEMSISQVLKANGNVTTPRIDAGTVNTPSPGGGGNLNVGYVLDDHERRIRALEERVFG